MIKTFLQKFLQNSKEDLRMVRKHSFVDTSDTLKEENGVNYMEKLATKI